MKNRLPILVSLAAAASVAGCASQYGYGSEGPGPYSRYYGQGEYYGHGDYDHHRDRGDYNRDYHCDGDGWR